MVPIAILAIITLGLVGLLAALNKDPIIRLAALAAAGLIIGTATAWILTLAIILR